MGKEKWMDIVGYEGYYKISSLGRVKGVERVAFKVHFGNEKIVKERFIAIFKAKKTGYLRVQLSKGGVNKKYSVHRLVAIAFLPNPNNKKCVNHKNGNKEDNSVGNLEWNTHKENIRHAIEVLGIKLGPRVKGFSWYTKKNLPCPAKKKVLVCDKNNNIVNEFDSAYEAESALNITHGLISQYCHGKRNNRKYNFKYA